jgi:integrase
MVQSVKAVNSLLDNADLKKPPTSPVSFLYDLHGQRKYLTVSERRHFLKVATHMPLVVRLFLTVLAYTGARISEVLALTPASFDEAEGLVVIECLKKRRRGVFRAVPLPRSLSRPFSQFSGRMAARFPSIREYGIGAGRRRGSG